ncbi:RNA polymerase sigma-I factor [Thermanaerosceptrum fracticalcis]|uniref:RNA polymerase sigma-I factor n=1 Tax=Thermanaerosceptrum fracticalcis TaxID=1712410 RepID=UPI0005547A87|nr:RNA polymerase sigma-I factor [Thermanaerosceptrum fracticalcis]
MFLLGLKQHIQRAQRGDEYAREQLIRNHRNFVAQICSMTCKRYLNWENDEELSIGLLALNEAIDGFDTNGKVKFTTYAQMVIKRRLIDYFRGQAKFQREVLTTPLEETNELERAAEAQAFLSYQESNSQESLVHLIDYYRSRLAVYGIDLNELPEYSPKHRDTRESLLQAALALVNDRDMLDFWKKNGQLPLKDLCESTGLSRKVLEKGRKYVIALAVIFTDSRLTPLKQFTNIP